MTFKEAKDELKKIAEGEYHSLTYELTEFRPDELETHIRAYVHGYSSGEGTTFRAALNDLKRQMGLPYETEVAPIPEVSA